MADLYGTAGDDELHGDATYDHLYGLAGKDKLCLHNAGVGVGAPQYGARRGFFAGIRKTF